jgi:putative aldouronate transport system permease protein
MKNIPYKKDIFFPLILHIFMILFSFLIIYPFWSVLVDSFNNDLPDPIRFFPKKFTVEAYQTVLQQSNTVSAFWNSLFRAVTGTTMATIITFSAAYAISKKKIPFNRLMTAYVIIPMFFSGGLIPTYLLISNLKLIDNRWVYILPHLFSGFNIFVTRNFINSIPYELEESALLDGANEILIAIKIYLPLSLPIIATIALWAAVGHWNSWFDGMIYIRTPSKLTLQVLLRRVLLVNQLTELYDDASYLPPVTPRSIQAALLFFTTLPILVVYPFAQKYFIQGLSAGAIKG